MNACNITLGSVNLGFAVLITAICIPLVKRKIRMNPWYGVRIPKSFESEENWYNINAYGGKRMILWALLPALVGIRRLLPTAGFGCEWNSIADVAAGHSPTGHHHPPDY